MSVASLAGGAYQLAAEANLPPEQRRREGQVMHIYLPDGSLAQHDGLLVRAPLPFPPPRARRLLLHARPQHLASVRAQHGALAPRRALLLATLPPTA